VEHLAYISAQVADYKIDLSNGEFHVRAACSICLWWQSGR
jgi:hypothetical protein